MDGPGWRCRGGGVGGVHLGPVTLGPGAPILPPHSGTRTLLRAALVRLGRDHPGLELRVTELDPVAVPSALHERRLDVGLLHDYDVVPVEPDPALDAVPLLEETVFLAVPGTSPPDTTPPDADPLGADPLGADPPDADPLGAVRHVPWIMATPGTLCHTVILHVCRAAGYQPRARHHADDFATVLALVAAGQGVSLVPQLAAADPPDGVRLVPLPTRRRTRIAYRRGAGDHPAVAAAVAAIRASTRAFLDRRA